VGQQPKRKLDFDISVSTTVTSSPPNRLIVLADLGELPAKSKGKAVVRIKNSTGLTFDFDQVKGSCSCLSAKVEDKQYAPGDAIDLLVTLETPPRSESQRVELPIFMGSNNRIHESLYVTLRYKLAGLLCFPRTMFVTQVSTDSETAETIVPVLVTDPIDPEFVQCKIGAEEEVKVERGDEGQWQVAIRVKTADIPSTGLTKQVTVFDPQTGRGDRALVTFTRTPPAVVRPRTIRFKPMDALMEASCMLKLTPPKGEDADDEKKEQMPAITAAIGKVSLGTKVTKMAKNVFRVTLRTTEDRLEEAIEASEDNPNVTWSILSSFGSYRIVSPVTRLRARLGE
jgi:hypothetical protein